MSDSTALIVIPALSFIYVGASLFINQAIGSRQRLKFIQAQVKDYQEKYKKATDAKDNKLLEELNAMEKEVTGYMAEMMTLPFKSLIFIIPVFFLFIGFNLFGYKYLGVVPSTYPTFSIILPIGLHLNQIFALQIFQSTLYGARGYFIISGVVAGIILEAVYSRYEAMQAEKKKAASTAAAPASPQIPPATPNQPVAQAPPVVPPAPPVQTPPTTP
jgi:uncharacterized membrane protein (DUF106 family)